MNFNVYVIHSAKPLPDLKKSLEECGGYIYAGIIYKSLYRKRDHDRGHVAEKEETKKTIVFCSEGVIKELELNHDYKGKIASYNWDSFPMPNEQHEESWDLHISGMPNDYTVKEAETFVIDTLKCVLQMNDNFIVEFFPRLRETGEIYGYGRVKFASHIEHDIIKLCKLVLHNTPISFKLNSKEKRMVTCVWHRLITSKRAAQKSKLEITEVIPSSDDKKYQKNVIKNKKPKKTQYKSENIKRARPASSAVRQVDVSNIVAESITPSAKIETINKNGVVATAK